MLVENSYFPVILGRSVTLPRDPRRCLVQAADSPPGTTARSWRSAECAPTRSTRPRSSSSTLVSVLRFPGLLFGEVADALSSRSLRARRRDCAHRPRHRQGRHRHHHQHHLVDSGCCSCRGQDQRTKELTGTVGWNGGSLCFSVKTTVGWLLVTRLQN